MIVLVANTKGGTGKSTLAINLAVERARTAPGLEPQILVIDGDRQETTLSALSRRAEDGHEPIIRVAALGDASAMRSQAPLLGVDYDDVVIDAGGRDNPTVRAAMLVADHVVMPFAPALFDLWEAENMATMIEEARVYNPRLTAAAVLTKVPGQGASGDEAAEALGDYDAFTLMNARLGSRVAFGRAAARGMSVSEWSPPDVKAVEELTALVDEMYGDR